MDGAAADLAATAGRLLAHLETSLIGALQEWVCLQQVAQNNAGGVFWMRVVFWAV